MKLKNKTVLVTGASGLIGRELVNSLAESGYKVVAMVRSQRLGPIKYKRIEVVKGDILNARKLFKNISSIDYVFHLAAYQNIDDVKYDEFKRVNVDGTQLILELSKKWRVKKCFTFLR